VSRIKILRFTDELDEKTLTRYENQGLVLISVNHAEKMKVVKGAPLGCSTVKYTEWIYHFRIPNRSVDGTDRL
jgi:hypothetical protein